MEEQNEQATPDTNENQNNADLGLTAVDLINKSNEASERMEKATSDYRKETEARAKAKLESQFDGKSSAGTEKKEETAEEYKDKVMRGEQ